MAELLTVDSLILEVREQANELNTSKPTQDSILRVLNRGQRVVNGVLAKHYSYPLLRTTTLDLTKGAVFPIPDDAYADMVEYIEISVPNFPAETRQRDYRESTRLQSAGTVPIPFAWTVEGHNVRFLQTPSGAYPAKMWYVGKLDKLTYQQGQVTSSGVGYVVVDSTGSVAPTTSLLSQDSDSPRSYVNVINYRTGEVKCTVQISSISGSRINFRATPVRATFQGRTVSGSASLVAATDDFICLAEGTCIPFFPDEVATFLVEYGAAEVMRSNTPDGNGARLEKQILDEYKDEIRASWTGREATARVKNRSQQWPNTYRRWPVSSK